MSSYGSGGETPVIRIVRKKKGHEGHHGGAWKVAYADFVTAMMAFFLVMWIVGLSKPMREAIAQYFQTPSGFVRTAKGGGTPLGMGKMDEIAIGKPMPIIPMTNAMIAEFQAVQETLEKDLAKQSDSQDMRDSVDVRLTDEGLRVELMEKTSSLFFDTGSAKLKGRGVRLLRTVAQELRKLKNPIVIEGHTDSRPLGRRGAYSNWELSTDRANAARRAMEANGIPRDQILAVRGYADKKLLRPSDPLHFSNRRVSILVAFDSKHQ